MAIEKQINSRIVNKSDTEANWLKAINFIPKRGETIYYIPEVDADGVILESAYVVESDGSKHLPSGRSTPILYTRQKVGDGFTSINNLPFMSDIENMLDGTGSNSIA